eukprot:TRINITY_DN10828_c0_g1_i2.p1 TRINITY_DN10828_c0_g1~~TRINITY_DN10828_c0_g1_i2.p1  ORF type:complete len:180 (-),score=23.99 TRINITY_DN10828_c0_g1_i2:276-734(-)
MRVCVYDRFLLQGPVILCLSNLTRDDLDIPGFWWMTAIGVGTYLIYVPFRCILFDRVVAATRFPGTSVFGIYVADATGYMGSVLLVIIKDWGYGHRTYLEFFNLWTFVTATSAGVLLVVSGAYFLYLAHRPEYRDMFYEGKALEDVSVLISS